MKKIFFILSFVVFALSFSFAQSNDVKDKIDALVKQGIAYHDRGEYDKAIEAYKKALELDSASSWANYEIALTYMYKGDNEKAIEHCDAVLKAGADAMVDAYIVKGSALDNLGKTRESIELFNEAIEKFNQNYLLYYNLAFDYYKIEEFENAEKNLLKALAINPYHQSSHLLLGTIKAYSGQRVQSMMSLYYFLLLEPDTRRSLTAFTLLQKQLTGSGAQKDGVASMTDSEFSDVEKTLPFAASAQDLDDHDIFIRNTESFFSAMGALKQKGKKNNNIYWDFYTTIFYDMAKSAHLETYCCLISQTASSKAGKWLTANVDKVKQFAEWLNKY
ncbi:MAG: tetratricopeptide repeat protein [Leptospirales bacterium]|nr:tetratricopeptide repeat protein [Leptospirales bacterium]